MGFNIDADGCDVEVEGLVVAAVEVFWVAVVVVVLLQVF